MNFGHYYVYYILQVKVMHGQNQILALELDSILIIYTESFY